MPHTPAYPSHVNGYICVTDWVGNGWVGAAGRWVRQAELAEVLLGRHGSTVRCRRIIYGPSSFILVYSSSDREKSEAWAHGALMQAMADCSARQSRATPKVALRSRPAGLGRSAALWRLLWFFLGRVLPLFGGDPDCVFAAGQILFWRDGCCVGSRCWYSGVDIPSRYEDARYFEIKTFKKTFDRPLKPESLLKLGFFEAGAFTL